MTEELSRVLDQFDIEGKIIDVQCKNTGNINKTYVVTYEDGTGNLSSYIFQKINTTVFKEPYKLMKNIEAVTDWILRTTQLTGDEHPCLKVIPTKKGSSLAVTFDANGEKQYYRVYNCIENSISYDGSKDENVVYNVGKAFGHFQKRLIDYPISRLEETIPDFHNTPKRYRSFLADIEHDVCGRAMEVSGDIVTILKNQGTMSAITDLIDKKKVPVRVTHNDTKVNNVMMDKKTGRYLTVIDLDTVMPGSILYDYGDGIRSAAANALEDETDLSQVYLNLRLFERYTDGYLSEMAEYLTDAEVLNLGKSIEVVTLELALRFLDDYINGDTYFKTTSEKHNLIRARNQLKLLSDIQRNLPYINSRILDLYKQKVKKI